MTANASTTQIDAEMNTTARTAAHGLSVLCKRLVH